MKNSKAALFVFIFLALALVSSGLAWRFYNETLTLRAKVVDLTTERDGLAKSRGNDEKEIKQLQTRVASLRSRDQGPADGADGAPPPDGGRPGRGRNGFAAMQAVLSSPEFQKLQALQMKAGLDARYASLFKALNLNPAQLAQFKGLLVDRQSAVTDALSAAREEGVNPRTDPQSFRDAIQSAQASVDDQIKSMLGDSGYAQYQQYEQTMPQRAVASQLQQSLSYSSTPLTDDQANQLVQLMAQVQSQNQAANGNANGNGGGGNGGGFRAAFGGGGGPGAALFGGGGGAAITDQVLSQAQGILSQPQVQALQQIQQQQQAQRQMQQLMRSAAQTNRGGANVARGAQ